MIFCIKCKVLHQGRYYPSSTDWGLTVLKAALPKEKNPKPKNKPQINKHISLGDSVNNKLSMSQWGISAVCSHQVRLSTFSPLSGTCKTTPGVCITSPHNNHMDPLEHDQDDKGPKLTMYKEKLRALFRQKKI